MVNVCHINLWWIYSRIKIIYINQIKEVLTRPPWPNECLGNCIKQPSNLKCIQYQLKNQPKNGKCGWPKMTNYFSLHHFQPKYILISLKYSLYLLKKIPPKKKLVAAVHSVSSRQIELLDLVYCLGGFKRDGSRLKRVLKFGENNRIWDFKIGRLFFIHRYTARGALHVQ